MIGIFLPFVEGNEDLCGGTSTPWAIYITNYGQTQVSCERDYISQWIALYKLVLCEQDICNVDSKLTKETYKGHDNYAKSV